MKDFTYSDNYVTLIDERDLILQQIDMMFDTNYGEVFGEYDYGANFQQFLWNLQFSNSDVSEYTRQIITQNIQLFDWELNVETTILEGTQNDIILVTIYLSKDFENIKKTYKIG